MSPTLLERHEARPDLAASLRRRVSTLLLARRSSSDDLRLAPFHLLASEGAVHVDRDHVWHMETLARCRREPASDLLIRTTPYQVVDLTRRGQRGGRRPGGGRNSPGVAGEGMVVKPREFLAWGRGACCSLPWR